MLAVGLLISLYTMGVLAEVVVVVSTSNSTNTLSKYALADLFMGKSSRFPDGSPAIPVDQADGALIRLEFYSEFTGKSPAQVKAHWSKMIFTGRGRPPKVIASGSEVKRWVASTPSGIGYIDRELVDDSVKVLTIE